MVVNPGFLVQGAFDESFDGFSAQNKPNECCLFQSGVAGLREKINNIKKKTPKRDTDAVRKQQQIVNPNLQHVMSR